MDKSPKSYVIQRFHCIRVSISTLRSHNNTCYNGITILYHTPGQLCERLIPLPRHPPVEELPAEPDPPAVVQDAPIPPPAEFEAKPEEESQHQREDSLHSSSSSSVEAAMATKEPGWYQQMFQNFATTVEECFPGGR